MRRTSAEQTTVLMVSGGVAASLAVAVAIMMAYNNPFYALLGGVSAMAAFAALSSNVAALCLLIAVGCLDGLIKGLFPTMATIVLKDVILALACFRWLWEGLNGHPRPSTSHPVALPAFLFIIYCSAQMFNSETGSFMVALAGLRSWIASIFVFFVVHDAIENGTQVRRVGWFIVGICVATAIYGVIQQQIGFDHLHRLSSGFEFYRKFGAGGTLRATSTYVSPGVFGATMVFALVLAIGLGFSSRLRVSAPLIGSLAAVICGMGIAASGSRGPLICAALAIVVLGVLARRAQLIPILAVLAIMIAWQSEKYVGELMGLRFSEQQLSKDVITSRALFPFLKGWNDMMARPLGSGVASGVGVGRVFSQEIIDRPVHITRTAGGFVENEVGRAMKELGLPGTILFLWLLWRSILGPLRGWRGASGRNRWLASALFAGLLGQFPGFAIGQVLYLGTPSVFFWLSCALCSRMPEYSEQEAEDPELDKRSPEEIAAWEQLAQRSGPRDEAPVRGPAE